MADLNGFDGNNVEPTTDFEPLPAGKYDPVIIHGKEYVPRRNADGQWFVLLTLIETRGNGGLFLCAPSRGCELVQGEFTALLVLTTEKRESLLEAAWALSEFVPEPVNVLPAAQATDELRPGDDFNARGDLRALLLKHGWTLAKSGENEYWRRPGKSQGWSASLKDRVFFVFSSNAAPFDSNQAYSPFAVCALLDHQGDFHEAGCALRRQEFGGETSNSADVDLSGIIGVPANIERYAVPALTDPGPLPDDENILGTLLTMYSAANSIYPMRRKAGKEPPGVIDQPCLVV